MKNNKLITIEKAAELLSVSTATIRNWINSGLLIKKDSGVSNKSAELLLKNINSGKIEKLNSRANKKNSSNNFIPVELSIGKYSEKDINSIVQDFFNSKLTIDKFMDEYLDKIKDVVLDLKIDPEILYQSLRSEGIKSKEGSYYTPDDIVSDIINDLKISKDFKVYDPCCGTGQFLKKVSEKYNDINIYGKDIDPTAIKIVDYHLSEDKSNKYSFEHTDSLLVNEENIFEIIITNPPWGAHYSKPDRKLLDTIFPEATSGDSLEYFLLKGYHSLKNNGVMSFVLPESFLYVKRFSNIRNFFLINSKILKIKTYGRKFAKVFSDIIRIDIHKSKVSRNHKITINADQKIKQSYFLDEFDYRFNINSTEKERAILDNIFSMPHITLKDNAKWSLGVVTGSNAEFVRPEKTKVHTLPIITGKNIDYFAIIGNIKYLSNNIDKLQQVPKNNIYDAPEKLIYKFISNKLVFAYDNTGKFTLNSANVLIPELKDYPIKVVMAILNSDLINFIYQKKFKSLKVLRSNLERLTFPKNPDKKIIKDIEGNVDQILNGKKVSKNILNNLVNRLYGILRF
ncbi:MAG: N-6 DNA methylase [Candidatus Delongbacteria bacterium]|jgi:predicted RNA methylase|nr:N-6 DNA methylase [Candidatus Delongbacteria bacterium]